MLRIISIVLGVVSLILMAYLGLVFSWLATRQSYRKIARNVSISTDWLSISPRPPLKVKHHVQHVYLAIEGYQYDLATPLRPVMLTDGTELNPEIQVLDEYGQVYNLTGLAGEGNLLGFSARFPRDRFYTEVKIRGDKPFRCSSVYWECSQLK
jgi:hypothetical protein